MLTTSRNTYNTCSAGGRSESPVFELEPPLPLATAPPPPPPEEEGGAWNSLSPGSRYEIPVLTERRELDRPLGPGGRDGVKITQIKNYKEFTRQLIAFFQL